METQDSETLLESLIQQTKLNNQLQNKILMSNIITNSKINKKDKQILLLLLQDRDRNYLRLNHNLQVHTRILEYLKVLQPIKVGRDSLIRVGGANDGGYVMYNKLLKANNGGGAKALFKNPKAISLGVSDYSPWDLEMAEIGYQVLEYDGSTKDSPYTHQNIIFHKKFISAHNSDSTITLESIIKDNKLDSTQANILQTDIENAEWEMLENIDIEILAQNFAQIIFEFHGCNPEEESGFYQRITQLKRLNKFFIPIHFHFNNHGKIFYSKGLFFSTSLEVSYINRSKLQSLGLDETQKLEKGILKDLDYPTWIANPEIPIRFCKQ
ncbi:hypothetical protein [uncultured Helicobacter sp.]|uniref:hypothetical protein n=1 Tax=uncultured Helicobacter sp. TaxID=175537 RepID=UPI00262CE01D|nr:hypothetical protein [uncultured Helicobacter sp.]